VRSLPPPDQPRRTRILEPHRKRNSASRRLALPVPQSDSRVAATSRTPHTDPDPTSRGGPPGRDQSNRIATAMATTHRHRLVAGTVGKLRTAFTRDGPIVHHRVLTLKGRSLQTLAVVRGWATRSDAAVAADVAPRVVPHVTRGVALSVGPRGLGGDPTLHTKCIPGLYKPA